MSAITPNVGPIASPLISRVLEEAHWYAVQTRPRYEMKVHSTLSREGVDGFLPLSNQIHRWSDRRVVVQVPMFPCYVFVRIVPFPTNRILVLRTSGVISFVGIHGQGIAIPDHQIEALQALVNRNVPATPYPFLRTGQRVRIRGGCLEGVEGILVSQNEKRKVVVSVNAIQKSLAISIEGYDIEPV